MQVNCVMLHGKTYSFAYNEITPSNAMVNITIRSKQKPHEDFFTKLDKLKPYAKEILGLDCEDKEIFMIGLKIKYKKYSHDTILYVRNNSKTANGTCKMETPIINSSDSYCSNHDLFEKEIIELAKEAELYIAGIKSDESQYSLPITEITGGLIPSIKPAEMAQGHDDDNYFSDEEIKSAFKQKEETIDQIVPGISNDDIDDDADAIVDDVPSTNFIDEISDDILDDEPKIATQRTTSVRKTQPKKKKSKK